MDENGDAGSIIELPDGWVSGRNCAKRLFARLSDECSEVDPAPWFSVEKPDYWGPFFGVSPEEYVFRQKLGARLDASFQKAVISGALSPVWFDGTVFKTIPTNAFGNLRVVRRALMDGRIEVDPLWPDEWQVWSNHKWAVPKDEFESWMHSKDAACMARLPMGATEIPPCDIVPINSRLPSDASRVPLSEAITWMAFDLAFDAERLERAINWQCLADGDLQAAQWQMEAATAALLKAGADGLVALYGRHMEAHGDKGRRTEKIDPLTLEDYRNALIVSHDSLYYGEGLFVWYRAPNDSHLRGSERRDHYTNVTVERDALLRHCGSRLDSMAALLMPIPAALPEVGAVMGLEEAVCLLAYGRPSHDIELWRDRAGNMTFLDPSGDPVPNGMEGEKPPHLVALVEANRRLWGALQDGTLRGLIAPADGPVVSVPRPYWNTMNPECLEYVYHGMSKSDAGRGCPVLLSRQAFAEWRTTKANTPLSGGDVPANRQLDHEEIIGMAASMRTDQPNISIGSAAASIVADLPNHPKTGKPRDTRHIERLIAHLWAGGR